MSDLTTIETCTIKLLPREQWISAAKQASAINPANAASFHMLQQAFPQAIIPPEHLALLTQKYWGTGGVRLTVGFVDNPPADLRARILSHMNAWDGTANVEFVETAGTAQVRIARTPGGGYWSYLGTDILSIPANQQTMNLDSFSMSTADSEFYRVIRHETGHTLGFPHEHTRREIVDRIDQEKAIAYFMASQGWSREQVIAQVLTPLDNSALIATADADPQSIMCYWLPASIMKDGVAVPGGTDIDAMDAQFAASVYPKQSGAGVVVVYDDSQYSGYAQELKVGRYDWGQIHNDTISSLKVPPGMKVTLYFDIHFQGKSTTFTQDTPYVGDEFNDQTSSILVELA